MSRRTLLGTLLWAIGLASVLGLVTGTRRAVSIEIWLAAFSCWFAAATLLRLFDQVPLFPPRLNGFVRLPRRRRTTTADHRPFALRGLEGLLIRARDHKRAHAQQLKPQLAALAMHYLPRHHGVDPVNEPERISDILGDVTWLFHPDANTRAPTLDEIETFFNRLIPIPSADQESAT